jgi:uncharacterized Fe-S cluster-containing radical SAM superfamily protein
MEPLQIQRSRKTRPLDTRTYSARLRSSLIDVEARSIRLTNFRTSEQSGDLSEPANANGFGRVHHFRRDEGAGWPTNPLPIDPACSALGLAQADQMNAQVFQSAGCNWRCWYCFVPFEDLTARKGTLITVDEMVDAYLAGRAAAPMVDLTGGQPDLTPEWPVWFLDELDRRGESNYFVWSDDNLSTDYFWRYLSAGQIHRLSEDPRYARAVCLKGFDSESFAFNTKAEPSGFDHQFELLHRLHDESQINYFGYVTFTTPNAHDISTKVGIFIDRLRSVSETMPLRTVPLQILDWGPVKQRLDPTRQRAMILQGEVVEAWTARVGEIYGSDADRAIVSVPR